jgi:outer membrane assembly lipoprotein YfiO
MTNRFILWSIQILAMTILGPVANANGVNNMNTCSKWFLDDLWKDAEEAKAKIGNHNKWTLQTLFGNEENVAIERFNDVINNCPYSDQAIDAELEIGDIYMATKRYEDAREYYKLFFPDTKLYDPDFVARHERHPKREYALYKWGLSYYKQTVSAERDQSSSRNAIYVFSTLLEFYPKSVHSDEAREIVKELTHRVAKSEMLIGDFNFRAKAYIGAFCRYLESYKLLPSAEWSKDLAKKIENAKKKSGLTLAQLGEECK